MNGADNIYPWRPKQENGEKSKRNVIEKAL